MGISEEEFKLKIDMIVNKVSQYLDPELTALFDNFEPKLGFNQADCKDTKVFKVNQIKHTEPFLEWPKRTAESIVKLGHGKSFTDYDKEVYDQAAD